MRALALTATLFGLALTAGPALAQPAAAPATPPVNLFASSAEVQALIDNARKAHPAGQPMFTQRMVSLPPYAANLEHRTATAPPSLHEKTAELFYVVEGAATLVTGGQLVDEKRSNAANLTGSAITGGETRPIAKGDLFLVPQSTPHQILVPEAGEVIVISVHVPRG